MSNKTKLALLLVKSNSASLVYSLKGEIVERQYGSIKDCLNAVKAANSSKKAIYSLRVFALREHGPIVIPIARKVRVFVSLIREVKGDLIPLHQGEVALNEGESVLGTYQIAYAPMRGGGRFFGVHVHEKTPEGFVLLKDLKKGHLTRKWQCHFADLKAFAEQVLVTEESLDTALDQIDDLLN